MEITEPQKIFLYDTLLPKLEVIALMLAGVGLALKLNLVNSGNMLLLVGLSTLSTVYFLRAFAPLKQISTDEVNFLEQYFGSPTNQFLATASEIPFFSDILMPKIIWLGGATAIIGILFKLMIWSGANNQLFVGLCSEIIVIIGLALNQRVNLRSMVLGVLTGTMLFINPKTWCSNFTATTPCWLRKYSITWTIPAIRLPAPQSENTLNKSVTGPSFPLFVTSRPLAAFKP